ncbi:alpha/beta hydrolase family protein [Herbidospora cretacea]|uniref:alpha/beta hydrolase family protein n=1 Tax=Herbidospora cretacea TaxID=28444 RepID=UPI0004C44CD6|nr:alpha/beta fold hydrolase [Herbidospora cretacea]
MPRLAVLIVLALLTGCGVAPDSPLADQCDTVPPGAERVVLRAESGVRLGAAVLGPPDAQVGMAVAHGAGHTLCDWLPEMSALAGKLKVRVIVPDRRGAGSSEGDGEVGELAADLQKALTWLHDQGATRLAALGSSYGGPIAVLAAQRATTLPMCVVIAVSPLTGIEGGVAPLAEDKPVPSLWTVAETAFGPNATALFEQVPQATKGRLTILPVDDHSLGLLRGHPEAMAFVEDALRTC